MSIATRPVHPDRATGPSQRDLPRDALLLLRGVRDRPRDAGPWGEPAFAWEGDRIRAQLAPIRDRRGLASSWAREAFRLHGEDPADRSSPARATRAAYLVRWLELGDGVRRAAWSAFVADSPEPRPAGPPEAPPPLSFADASLPALLHDPA